jgi:hypothetical protein
MHELGLLCSQGSGEVGVEGIVSVVAQCGEFPNTFMTLADISRNILLRANLPLFRAQAWPAADKMTIREFMVIESLRREII